MTDTDKPLTDPAEEAHRLVALFAKSDVQVCFLGGLGILLHKHSPVPNALRRQYQDIDLVVKRSDRKQLQSLLEAAGYQSFERFNAIHGQHRLLYFDADNERKLDVFVETFKMCHMLPLGEVLPLEGSLLSPADLLLTKLQVYEINEKDLLDCLALLLDHDVQEDSDEAVDSTRIMDIVGRDWGWHTTLSDNLVKMAELAESIDGLTPDERNRLAERIAAIQWILDEAPKSLRWKLREVIGRRVPWYDLPEEI
jgi:hypothetical protein